jgi:PAS domain S-box-containing protein
LIAVISRRSLTNRADAEAILQMVGQRAASELERLDIEAELQESDLRFRHLLQSVPNVAVQGYGADGTTLYWNDASEHLYGYTAQEALGRNLVELIIPPEMRDVVKQLIRQMAETGQQIPAAEVSLMRKDGSRVDVFSSHATVQIPGQPLALFCIDIDITERKAAEAQRAEAFVALQQEKDELKRWQSLTVGRELKMVELKKEVNTLLKQAGQPEAYKIVEGKIE